MPEQDDKREGSTRGEKSGDRRFWRALAGDKRSDNAREPDKGSSSAGTESSSTPAPSVADSVDKSIGDPVEHPGPDAVDLTPGDEQRLNPAERAARRDALRSMLHRSEARHNNVRRKRRPVLTAGTQVRVASGPHVGEEGVILDADYIESRVLLALGGSQTPTWVSFDQVAGPRRKN